MVCIQSLVDLENREFELMTSIPGSSLVSSWTHSPMAAEAWDLEMELLCLPSTGGSVHVMQRLASKISASCRDTPAHVVELAKLANNSHRERDLHRWVDRQPWRRLLPAVYEFALPYTEDGVHEHQVLHAAFLPHEFLASLSQAGALGW